MGYTIWPDGPLGDAASDAFKIANNTKELKEKSHNYLIEILTEHIEVVNQSVLSADVHKEALRIAAVALRIAAITNPKASELEKQRYL
jgi:hypothetical protein